MLSFKEFLLEYLTPLQSDRLKAQVRRAYPEHDKYMTPKARQDTDHFFGKGNDHVKEEILNYDHDKSEIHRKVENHLNQTISHEDYKKGIIISPNGNPIKLNRIIKDPQLKKEFSEDNTRSGAKASPKPYMSIVRGIEVGGQTNPASNELHPKGHAWAEESCKNVDTGCNRKYLKGEIANGTIIVRAHDHTGKEIYRAGLQPFHNNAGDVIYKRDSEYGIKHPSFTAHADDVAKRLSNPNVTSSTYYKHLDVYKNDDNSAMLHPKLSVEQLNDVWDNSTKPWKRELVLKHPNATSEHITKGLNDESKNVKITALNHPNATSEHIDKGLNDPDKEIRSVAIRHPNATSEQINKALNDKEGGVRIAAIRHAKVTPEHIDKALDDPLSSVRSTALRQPNANSANITKGLEDLLPSVRDIAIRHPNATPEHINKALDDEVGIVREAAIGNKNATPENITKGLSNESSSVRIKAIQHPNVTPEHIDKALSDRSIAVREMALHHPNASGENINKGLDDVVTDIRVAAISHPNVTSENITKALNDKSNSIRAKAINNPKATSEHIDKALNDPDDWVRVAAISHPNVTSEHISKALNDKSEFVRVRAINKPTATKEHYTQALNSPHIELHPFAITRLKQINQEQ